MFTVCTAGFLSLFGRSLVLGFMVGFGGREGALASALIQCTSQALNFVKIWVFLFLRIVFNRICKFLQAMKEELILLQEAPMRLYYNKK